MWSLASDNYVVAVLSQILAPIFGANFSDYSTVVTMWSPYGCYLNDLIFGLLWLHSGRNVVTNFRPLFMVTIFLFFCTKVFDFWEKQIFV